MEFAYYTKLCNLFFLQIASLQDICYVIGSYGLAVEIAFPIDGVNIQMQFMNERMKSARSHLISPL